MYHSLQKMKNQGHQNECYPQYNTRFVCFCTLIQTPISGFRTSYRNSLHTPDKMFCHHSLLFKVPFDRLCNSCVKVIFLVPIQVLSLVLLGRSHNACHVTGRSVTNLIRLSGLSNAFKIVFTTSKLVRSLCPPTL